MVNNYRKALSYVLFLVSILALLAACGGGGDDDDGPGGESSTYAYIQGIITNLNAPI